MNYHRQKVTKVAKKVAPTTFNVTENVTAQQIRGLQAKLQML
jgi:hypothetical protein